MPVDARGLSAHVLVDGRAVPELADPDTTPRDWAFLRTAATNGQVSPEAAAACAQSKCLVATTAGTRFEVVVVNATRHHLCVDTFVDGRKIDSLSLFGEHAVRDEQTGAYGPDERHVDARAIEGDYVARRRASIATNAVRPALAQLRQVEEGGPATRDFGAASQAGRIDVVARVIENLGDKKLMAAAPAARAARTPRPRAQPKRHFWPGHFLWRCHRDGGELFRVRSHAHAQGVTGSLRGLLVPLRGHRGAPHRQDDAQGLARPRDCEDRSRAAVVARPAPPPAGGLCDFGAADYLVELSPLAGPGAPKAVADV